MNPIEESDPTPPVPPPIESLIVVFIFVWTSLETELKFILIFQKSENNKSPFYLFALKIYEIFI